MNFELKELLNIDASIGGFKLPIPFKLYKEYHTKCHEYFDFVISQKIFRERLGQQYSTVLLKQ